MIKPVELELGVRLPPDYVARLQRDNGGEVLIDGEPWWLFPVRDDTDRTRIARTANHIVLETRSLRSSSGFPAAAVAIAGDGGGNALVLMPGKADPPSLADDVYRWDHETGEVQHIADSIADHSESDE